MGLPRKAPSTRSRFGTRYALSAWNCCCIMKRAARRMVRSYGNGSLRSRFASRYAAWMPSTRIEAEVVRGGIRLENPPM